MRKIGYLAAALAAAATGAQAQTGGDARRGGELAGQWCASCHGTGEANGQILSDAAPSFQTVAERPTTTATSLRLFLQTPHRRMPNFALSGAETDDAVAYILSLKR
jgi:cytochrome c